jgi:hypothetical protein
MAAENRVVVELPARYEAAKNAVREYEQRVAKALHYASTLSDEEARATLQSILLGYDNDNSV